MVSRSSVRADPFWVVCGAGVGMDIIVCTQRSVPVSLWIAELLHLVLQPGGVCEPVVRSVRACRCLLSGCPPARAIGADGETNQGLRSVGVASGFLIILSCGDMVQIYYMCRPVQTALAVLSHQWRPRWRSPLKNRLNKQDDRDRVGRHPAPGGRQLYFGGSATWAMVALSGAAVGVPRLHGPAELADQSCARPTKASVPHCGCRQNCWSKVAALRSRSG
jgi:hypothetical protein